MTNMDELANFCKVMAGIGASCIALQLVLFDFFKIFIIKNKFYYALLMTLHEVL